MPRTILVVMYSPCPNATQSRRVLPDASAPTVFPQICSGWSAIDSGRLLNTLSFFGIIEKR